MRRPADACEAVAIGIPARNESATIGACLASVGLAAASCGLPVALVVAADDCTDDTITRAALALERLPHLAAALVIDVHRRTAGGARDAACRAALDALPVPADRVWLATTDADGTVPPDWLARQLAWAARGADGVAGLVAVDPAAPHHLRARIGAHLARPGTGLGHPHVHGANLGVRAHRWLGAGGFAHVAVGEDQTLWATLGAGGAHLVAAPDGIVTTSGRLVGRAPDGFAAVLSTLVGAAEPHTVSAVRPSGIGPT